MTNLTLPIGGMSCAACAARVEETLSKTPGVSRAAVNIASEKATVQFDRGQVTESELVKAVDDLGYKVLTEKQSFKVRGITCAACVARVEQALQRVPGVIAANVNFATEKADVEYVAGALTLNDLRAAIESAGYGVEPDQPPIEHASETAAFGLTGMT